MCEPCAEGKHQRYSFPTEVSRASKPLAIIHADVCGPMVVSIDDSKYFVTFIDDYTRKVYVHYIKGHGFSLF